MTAEANPDQGPPTRPTRGKPRSEVRSLAMGRAQEIIEQKVRQTVANPNAVRSEPFPPPAMQRPEGMVVEGERRKALAVREAERRAALLTAAEEEEAKEALRKRWRKEDRLDYKPRASDKEVEVYAIEEPYAYVQIIRNQEEEELLYHVIEPILSHDEKTLLRFIEDTLVDVLEMAPEDVEELGEGDPKELEKYIVERFEGVISDYGLQLGDDISSPEDSRARILYYVLRDFIGEGPMDVLMRDPWIEDISCDGPHVPIFVYHRRYESITTSVRFRDDDHLDGFVIRLAQRASKHVSIAEPVLDATMRDGSRLQATLAKEVSSFGSTFTVRRFRETPFSPLDLLSFGTLSPEVLAFLWMVIEHKMSAIYAGGTASGKTTSLNALMTFIPPGQKVVTIEDTRELKVPQPNWIAGITREGFGPTHGGHRAGEIGMFQLLRNALRQRPEYIIVGEVRGEEAYNLFQAMATGHAAYGTLHADSVDAAIHRLESDPINIPRALLEALDVVCVQVQTRVGGKRVRRTKQVTEIVGLDPNTREILTNEVFHWEPDTDTFRSSGTSYVLQRIAAESGKDLATVRAELKDRAEFLAELVQRRILDYASATWAIRSYQKDPKRARAYMAGGPAPPGAPPRPRVGPGAPPGEGGPPSGQGGPPPAATGAPGAPGQPPASPAPPTGPPGPGGPPGARPGPPKKGGPPVKRPAKKAAKGPVQPSNQPPAARTGQQPGQPHGESEGQPAGPSASGSPGPPAEGRKGDRQEGGAQ